MNVCVCVLNQACREGELTQKLQEEQFCLLQCAVVEAEGIILDAVAKLDDPIHVCCISSPGKTAFISHPPKKNTFNTLNLIKAAALNIDCFYCQSIIYYFLIIFSSVKCPQSLV